MRENMTAGHLRRMILSGEDAAAAVIRLSTEYDRQNESERQAFQRYAIRAFQSELRQVLTHFLRYDTGLLPWRGWRDTVAGRLRTLVDLAQCIEPMDTGHPFVQAYTGYNSNPSGRKLAEFVAAGCRILDERFLPLVCAETVPEKVVIQPADRKRYTGDGFLSPVLGLLEFARRKMKPFISDLLVHGSLATLDYVPGFSDFDTLVIINRATLLDPGALLELRGGIQHSLGFVYAIDPLQHHGFIFTGEIDLEYYSPPLMPLEVLSRSLSLMSDIPSVMKIGVREAKIESESAFMGHYRALKALKENKAAIKSFYDMKFFISRILILPTLYLQLKGVHRYKKDAFEEAKEDFSPEIWRIVEEASQVRIAWQYEIGLSPWWYRAGLRAGTFYPPLVGFVRNRFQVGHTETPSSLLEILGDYFVDRSFTLVDEMARVSGLREE